MTRCLVLQSAPNARKNLPRIRLPFVMNRMLLMSSRLVLWHPVWNLSLWFVCMSLTNLPTKLLFPTQTTPVDGCAAWTRRVTVQTRRAPLRLELLQTNSGPQRFMLLVMVCVVVQVTPPDLLMMNALNANLLELSSVADPPILGLKRVASLVAERSPMLKLVEQTLCRELPTWLENTDLTASCPKLPG